MKDLKCQACDKNFSSKKMKLTCSQECSYKLRVMSRHVSHEPVEKICCDCSVTFADVTKRKTSTRCYDCARRNMVKTRKEKGSYIRSQEQNEKLSNSLKEKYKDGWNPNTPEHCEKLSNNMKNRWADGSMREKSKESSLKKYGVDHWTKSEGAKDKLSSISKGRKFSIEARKNMSIGASNRVRNKRELTYTSAKGGCREDLNGMYFRSCWEANFARILNLQGKKWEYEPATFALSSGKSYTPDFFCDGKYFELKGRMTENCYEKIRMFREEYPNVSIELIDSAKYDDLRVQYKHLIPFWEGK